MMHGEKIEIMPHEVPFGHIVYAFGEENTIGLLFFVSNFVLVLVLVLVVSVSEKRRLLDVIVKLHFTTEPQRAQREKRKRKERKKRRNEEMKRQRTSRAFAVNLIVTFRRRRKQYARRAPLLFVICNFGVVICL
jgi:hypothetical protein